MSLGEITHIYLKHIYSEDFTSPTSATQSQLSDSLGCTKAICERMTDIASMNYRWLEESINKGLQGLASTLIMPVRNAFILSACSV